MTTPPTNIALFPSAFHPHVGGVEELTRQLARQFLRQNLRPIIITNRWPRNLPSHETYQDIPIYRLPFRTPEGSFKANFNYHLTHRSIQRSLLAILRKHKIDLLHIQCVSSNAPYALHAHRRLGLPLVVTLQGELTMDATGLYRRSPLARAYLQDVLASANAITACSSQTLSDAQAFFAQPFGPKASVIYNGVSLADFAAPQPHPHPRPYILAIGRHVHQKGFDLLLQAFAKANARAPLNHDLILAGNGPEHETLKALAKSLAIDHLTHFPGHLDRPAAAAHFKAASFFVLPSRLEPFGIVNLEAMAAGTPLIATRTGGVPEFVHHHHNGLLVDPENPDHLAHALSLLAHDPALRQKLAANARSHVASFDWPVIANQYLALYSSLLPEKPVKSLFHHAPA